MKKAIISICAILLMVSCQKNELVPEYVSGECDLYASIESLDVTKTVMDKDNNVLWSAGDQIVAFMGTTIGVKYQIKESFVGSSAGGFSKVADSESGDDLVAGQEIDHNVVLYPYSASAWCMKNDSNTPTSLYKLNVVLPETQFYAENSFGIGAFPMVAVSEDNNLTFKNICGGLKLQFIGTAKIKSIKLEGLAGEKISGKSSVVADTEKDVPKITMATSDESYSHVTLDCGEGVQLSETNPTTFIIAVPPMEFASGMQITVTDTDGLSRTLTNSSKNTIKRSSLLKFPVITYKQEGASPAPSEPEGDDVDINQYIVYNGTGKNNNTVISGDSSWDLEPFFYSRVSDIDEIEMKFQMGPSTASPYDSEMRWLFSSERPYTNNGARLSSDGLVLRYGNFGEDVIKNEKVITWDEMGVSMTDKIVLKISVSQQKITINGKEISVPGMETFTDIEYLFSSYYYVNDDGYAKNYVTVPVESKLYYAKIWNTEGSLLYHGYASEGEKSAGNTQPVWKSEYNGSTRLEFPNTNFQSFWVSSYTTSWLPFGGGIDEDVVNLSEGGTANSYIVSQKGTYKFSTVKGNSSESVGAVASAEVLWETFGTNVTPNVGDLVKNAVYSDGYITFQTSDTFNEGNAVIAAKDASGNILWSWHIWLTDQPQEQVYFNNAGTMMDRNLGATSATPGDVGALGLLYQWGRKDPFLGSSSISNSVEAKSTITWPSPVSSDSSNGTIEYATTYPTTFIIYNGSNYDWYYTGDDSTDNTRWATSNKTKSIYDPCPFGWRVSDGGSNGVWSKALGSSSSFTDSSLYDSTNEGINFSGKFGSDQTIWLPASGCRSGSDGGLYDVGSQGGYCWSASPFGSRAYFMDIRCDGDVNPSHYEYRAHGMSVRCLREGSISPTPDPAPVPVAVNLSQSGTANSYIVSSAGLYKFSTVKGNGSESVGAVASAEVLWETFGTDVTPNVGDLVKNAVYSDGYITFQTSDTFNEGNAVIAAKDASGNILWSWHIWLTDQPQEQVYFNNAGTMMDRNLGATSATPGDVGALGLLYQWGRKDPFLGSSSISESVEAKSTIIWPSYVESNSSNGTIEYATVHPTTFIIQNSNNCDWYYTESISPDNTRWTTSETSKSIYDPCPVGWRVTDGDSNGVWSKSLGSSSSFTDSSLYDSTSEGMNFFGKFGSDQTIWYPASGYRDRLDGSLSVVGNFGYYWSASPFNIYAYGLRFYNNGSVNPSYDFFRASGRSVRCLQE